MSNGSRALKTLQDNMLKHLEQAGAEIRNARAIPAPPQGFWIYLKFRGQRFKLQLESLDNQLVS